MMTPRLADLDPGEVMNQAVQAGKAGRRSVMSLVLQILTGVALGLAMVYVSERYRVSLDWGLIPIVAVGYCLAVLAHEAGHALAAASQNFRISAFAAWPLRVYRDSAGWHLGWVARRGPKGFVAITPVSMERLRTRQFIVVAAGPLTSALAGAAGWMLIVATGRQPKWVIDELLIFTLCSALLAVLGFLPIRSGGTVSDGARLQMLVRGGAEWDRLSALQAIAADATSGTRPREWSAELIAMAAGPDDQSPDSRTGRLLRYSWLADQGRVDDAEEELVWLVGQPWPGPMMRSVQLEAAWFAAFYRSDAITARRWFDAGSTGVPMPSDCTRPMAETALALVENRFQDAQQLIPEALKECELLTDRGTAMAIRDALAVLQARVDAHR